LRALAAALLAALVLGACGSSQPVRQAAASHSGQTEARTPTTTVAKPKAAKPKAKAKPRPKPKPRPDPGALPQTKQRPTSDTPGFRAEMAALWSGVQANSLAKALPAFFPEAAYLQVKAIGNAAGDYTGRLLGDYHLDLAAAHTLLGARPGAARLVAVKVPEAYAHWVPPNVCYNRVGYYEVPNARVVYSQNGALHSFGIASMISWRGVWYVVHLGAVVRSADAGVVDDPSSGPGVSVASSTC
jgi:hypothetical protein